MSAGRDLILLVLRRYKVMIHYRATTAAEGSRYAVFRREGGAAVQVGEPTTHAEAQRRREELIADDLVRLFGTPRAQVGAAGSAEKVS